MRSMTGLQKIQNMKKSRFEKFQEDYTAVIKPASNKRGFKIEYVYYSSWFIWNLPEAELKKRKNIILAACIACAAVYILTAVSKSDFNSLSFVAFPSLFALCALVIEVFGVGQFYCAKYRTTRFIYENSNRRLRICPIVVCVCSAFAAAGCVYYMVIFGGTTDRVFLLFGHALEAVLSYFIYRQYSSIPFTTEENDILNHVERATLD